MFVLLVEDSEVMRTLAVKQLEALGHTVETVSNGWYAVLSAQGSLYDVILMDLQMPIMDGWDATRLIRQAEREQKRSRTPIIAVTAIFDRDTCLCADMDDYLAKPVSLQQLDTVLKKWRPGSIARGTVSLPARSAAQQMQNA